MTPRHRAIVPRTIVAAWLAACAAAAAALPPAPAPENVAVLYNSSLEESAALARYYAGARGIPEDNLVGLPMPEKAEISRDEFESRLRDPLAAEFTKRGWWQMGQDQEGRKLPVANRIRVLACMRGVPLKVKRAPDPAFPAPEPGQPPPQLTTEQRFQQVNEASVDGELCILGIGGLVSQGSVRNQYYKSEQPIVAAQLPFLMLVGRIDAHDDATCRRLVDDALATERSGLWGRAYVDIANKFPQGDDWLRQVAERLGKAGIPTIVDRFSDTLPTNYPMTEAALYFGWYAGTVNGPLLAPDFRFRTGAVAMHLHSFSASQLTDPNRHWCAPILARGACATIGNVYEPFLGMTHDLGIFTERLLAGHTLVEAAYMASPGLSWQHVVLGDPLYRPFLHLDGSGEKRAADAEFRALRVAAMRWGDEPEELDTMLRRAADKLDSPTILEALGLRKLAEGDQAAATGLFEQARNRFGNPGDRIRQELHLVAIDRAAGRKPEAVRRLRDMQTRYAGLPQASAVTGWLNILDPPPPNQAQPGAKAKTPAGSR